MIEPLAEVLSILYHNGFQPSRDSYDAFERYKADPAFAAALGSVFTAPACPALSAAAVARLPPAASAVAWGHFRMLAGISLKNSLSTNSSPHAVVEAGKCCVAQLRDASTTSKLACTAAQIGVKICSIVGRFEWWSEVGICNFASLILNELLTASAPDVVLGGLYCLQFLFEDTPKLLGETSDTIITCVTQMASQSAADGRLRKAAFKVALHGYEIGATLEWNVENHAPMQRGLVNGCHAFAQCCTLLLSDPHSPLSILALQGAALLLDYVDYFMVNPETARTVVTTWVQAATYHIHSPATPEHAKAASDFLMTALSISESNAGEGSIVHFERAITAQLAIVVPKLFEYIVFTPDDVASIMENDRFSFRDVTKVLHRATSAVPLDADDDGNDDEVMSELRKSAASCIDKICVVAHREATPLIKAQMVMNWGHQNWIIKEAALLGLGCAVRGCMQDLAQDLPGIMGNLESIIRDPQQHVCTVSMAMWCVDRLAEWLFNAGHNSVSSVMSAIVQRLVSESKRIQQSATTALQKLLRTSHSAQIPMPSGALEGLATTIIQCLQGNLYNTKCLSSLCDLAICVVAMIPPQSQDGMLMSFAGAFYQARQQAMTAFEVSYNDTIIEQKPHHSINSDVMSLDRVVVASFIQVPQPELHVQLLSTWAGVLWDIAKRRCFDDADLVFSSLFTASRLVGNLGTAHLTTWLASRNYDIVKATLEIAENCGTHSCIRCSCLEMLECVVRVAQASAIDDTWTRDTTYRFVNAVLDDAVDDDPVLYCTTANIVTALIVAQPCEQSLAVFVKACGKLRHDSVADSREFHMSAAFKLVSVLAHHPTLLAHIPLVTVAELIGSSPNSTLKTVPTKALCHALTAFLQSNPADSTNPMPVLMNSEGLRRVLRVVFSWQQSAAEYQDGTHEALQSFMHALAANPLATNGFLQILRSLQQSFASQIATTYALTLPQ